jgi:ribosomal protein S14
MRLSAKKAAHHFSQRVLRCRKSGNPDFLWSFVGPPNCMRLSAKKAAHHFSQRVLRCRKSGEAESLP